MDRNGEKPLRLLSCGELLWDLFEGERRIGGAAFNLAAHAAQCGLEAHLLSRVGRDTLGQEALQEAARLGVASDAIQVDPSHPTGTVTVSLAAGQPTYTIHAPVAWDFITVDAAMLRGLAAFQFDAVCFGTLAQRSEVSHASLQRVLEVCHAAIVFFDVNLRQRFYSRDLVEEGLSRATVLKLNDEEMPILAHLLYNSPTASFSDSPADFHADAAAFTRALQRRHPQLKTILITQGAHGCLVAHGAHLVNVPGEQVTVVDAVGAGDAFSAAFLAARLRGKSAVEAVQEGNALGAYVVGRRGAVPTE